MCAIDYNINCPHFAHGDLSRTEFAADWIIHQPDDAWERGFASGETVAISPVMADTRANPPSRFGGWVKAHPYGWAFVLSRARWLPIPRLVDLATSVADNGIGHLAVGQDPMA